MKINAALADNLLWENIGNNLDGYTVVERGDWIEDGKTSSLEIIFSFEDSFYQLWRSRSGSYHTDYYYDTEYTKEFECPEVESVEVTTRKWKIVEPQSKSD